MKFEPDLLQASSRYMEKVASQACGDDAWCTKARHDTTRQGRRDKAWPDKARHESTARHDTTRQARSPGYANGPGKPGNGLRRQSSGASAARCGRTTRAVSYSMPALGRGRGGEDPLGTAVRDMTRHATQLHDAHTHDTLQRDLLWIFTSQLCPTRTPITGERWGITTRSNHDDAGRELEHANAKRRCQLYATAHDATRT